MSDFTFYSDKKSSESAEDQNLLETKLKYTKEKYNFRIV